MKQACSNCKHRDIAGILPPCNECIKTAELPSWEPAYVVELEKRIEQLENKIRNLENEREYLLRRPPEGA